MGKIIHVLAGNKEEFEEYVNSLKREESNDFLYKFVDNLQCLEDFDNESLNLIYVGSYMCRHDIDQILSEIGKIKFKGERDNMDLEATYITVNVRWWDGYLETFQCQEVRGGSDLLWLRLKNGQNRNIPLRHVRWYSQNPESHAKITKEEN